MTTDDLLDALRSLPYRAITPNDAQSAVMRYNDGPLWVIAGPGTGKTEALNLRCLRLLCVDGTPPESILYTTYTRKAARQLEHRLHLTMAALGELIPAVRQIDVSRMRLGTLHGICWDLLTETPGSSFRLLQLLDELERAFFVRTQSRICRYYGEIDSQLLQDLLAWAENSDNPVVSGKLPPPSKRGKILIGLCQRLVEDQVDRKRLAQQAPHLALLDELITEYESQLRDHHFTDNTFVQQQALDLLRTGEGKAVVHGDGEHSGIQHVIVDEYQDTNPLQAALYRELAGRSPHNLCVVGDDDQALFRFRGGTVSCMVRFGDECQRVWPTCHVESVQLTHTYRSHPEIVRWLNNYVTAHPQMTLPYARVSGKAALTPARTERPEGPVVWLIRGKNTKELARNFAEALRQFKDKQVIESVAQCALLAHSIKPGPATLGPYLDALREQGISVARADPPREHPLYRQVLGTLLMALDPFDNLRPPNYAAIDRGLQRYVAQCRAEALRDVAGQIHSWLTTNKDAPYIATLSDLAWQIINTRECMRQLNDDPEVEAAARAFIQTLDAYDRVAREGHHSIELDSARRGVSPQWMQRLYNILVQELFDDREMARRADEDLEASVQADALQVVTIHSAKGLEFPVVAVVVDGSSKGKPDKVHRLERAVMPFRRDLPSGVDPSVILGGSDEARAAQDTIRLHYVAYSRAQEVLLLLVLDQQREEPRALSVGPTEAWLQQHVKGEWPNPFTKRQQKRNPAPSEGVQLELFK